MRSEKDQKYLFETAQVSKAVLSLAIPTVVSQLITVVYNMADTFFVGQLNDPAQVAAATLAMPLFMFLTAFANLFGIGGSSVISRSLGKGKKDEARHCSAFCVWAGIVSSVLYGILVWVFHPSLFQVLGATDATYEHLKNYLFWTVTVGALPTVMNTELAHLVRSEGYASQASIGVALGGLLNIGLDPLFIFGFHMQITGAAIATMLSNACAVLYFLLFLHKIRENTSISLNLRDASIQNHIPAAVLTAGLPSAVMTLMSTLFNTVLNNLISGYSTEAVAGMGIAKKVDLVAYQIAQGMTQGTLPLIGYNYASGNRKRMSDSVHAMFRYILILALCAMAALLMFSSQITTLFIHDAATVRYGAEFLRIICIACPTTALNFSIITVFQATGAKIRPLVLSFLRKGTIDIPLMIFFNNIKGIDAIAWATPIADQIALITALNLFIPYLSRISKAERPAVQN